MKKEGFIGVRVPTALKGALERERKRVSRVSGIEVNASDVVRMILEERLGKRRSTGTGRRAA